MIADCSWPIILNNMVKSIYVVATPIGNLEDITLRALRILKEVDYILCEDKRVTSRLLNKYKIKTKLISFHKFNESKTIDYVLDLLGGGNTIALVSDAGTPLVSDPGGKLVSKAHEKGIKVIPIPGASALSSTLSASGFELNDFLFVGFLPGQKLKREKLILSFKERSNNVVLFVAPHDLKKYLNEIFKEYPDVHIFYARELTKMYEEIWAGSVENLINKIKENNTKGEIVLMLNFGNVKNKTVELSQLEILGKLKKYTKEGFSLKEATKILGEELEMPRKYLYDLYVKESVVN